jgi:DNA-binding IclR family transcriptional regulator
MESVSGVGVLDKSVAILAVLAERGPASLAELVAATTLSRPTVHRLARALEDHGLVGRDERGRFCLGARLAAWGRVAEAGTPLLAPAAPVLAALRDATGESAQLYVREGDHRVCIAVAERPSGLRDTVPVGARLPLTAGSGAKVLLAWSPATGWPEGSDPAELARVRRAGWAASVAEREAGVASVSAPVRDRTGAVVAAISVSGPMERLGRQPGTRFSRAVVGAAHELTSRLV